MKNFRSKDSSWAEFERSQKAREEYVRAFTKLTNVFDTIAKIMQDSNINVALQADIAGLKFEKLTGSLVMTVS